jgi:hypothetical protein
VAVAVGDGLSMRGMGGMNVWADTSAATQKPDKAQGNRDAVGLMMTLRSCNGWWCDMALKVKRPTVVVVLVEERRAVLFTVMECGSSSGSGSLMSFITNIDDFHGCAVVVIKLDPISLTYALVSWMLQTIANRSFMLFIQSKTLMRDHFTDVVQGNFIAK